MAFTTYKCPICEWTASFAEPGEIIGHLEGHIEDKVHVVALSVSGIVGAFYSLEKASQKALSLGKRNPRLEYITVAIDVD